MSNLSITTSFYLSPIIDKIHEAGDNRAGHDLLRESIFFRLLVFSADGLKFSDAKHFSKLLGVPAKQAALVWDICLSNNVLRKIGVLDEYSAFAWMKDNGLVSYSQSVEVIQKRPETTKQKVEAKQSKTKEAIELLSKEPENIAKELPKVLSDQSPVTPTTKATRRDEIKEQVRPNVRLSREELLSLKKSYSDEEISRMLDRLSEYKTNTGRTYSSDYQAITKWVCKDVGKQSLVTKPPVELPSWLFGETA